MLCVFDPSKQAMVLDTIKCFLPLSGCPTYWLCTWGRRGSVRVFCTWRDTPLSGTATPSPRSSDPSDPTPAMSCFRSVTGRTPFSNNKNITNITKWMQTNQCVWNCDLPATTKTEHHKMNANKPMCLKLWPSSNNKNRTNINKWMQTNQCVWNCDLPAAIKTEYNKTNANKPLCLKLRWRQQP